MNIMNMMSMMNMMNMMNIMNMINRINIMNLMNIVKWHFLTGYQVLNCYDLDLHMDMVIMHKYTF